MLRYTSSLLASIALVFLGLTALGAVISPAPELKVIATVTAHAHPHQVAQTKPQGL
jgi:hypothetical protein